MPVTVMDAVTARIATATSSQPFLRFGELPECNALRLPSARFRGAYCADHHGRGRHGPDGDRYHRAPLRRRAFAPC